MNNYFIPLNNGIFFLYIYFALVVDIKTFIFFFFGILLYRFTIPYSYS